MPFVTKLCNYVAGNALHPSRSHAAPNGMVLDWRNVALSVYSVLFFYVYFLLFDSHVINYNKSR